MQKTSNMSESNTTLSMLDNGTTSPQTDWLLHPDLHQVALGIAWALLCVIGLAVNLFICVYTVVYMCKKRTSTRITTIYTSQSSLLLFNLSLAFVLESLVGLPFIAVATASGEWMIGLSDDVKQLTCVVSGFALHWGYSVSLHSLAVISVERFLFISKPHIHKTRFTNKVSLAQLTMLKKFTKRALMCTQWLACIDSSKLASGLTLQCRCCPVHEARCTSCRCLDM